MPATSNTIRASLVDTLRLDLIGPDNNHAFAHELLPQSPSKWYLTGFLVPVNTPDDQRADETAQEEIGSGAETTPEEESPMDRAASRRSFFPSSIGLSMLVAPGIRELKVRVEWGDYHYEGSGAQVEPDETDHDMPSAHEPDAPVVEGRMQEEGPVPGSRPKGYRRSPRTEMITVPLIHSEGIPHEEMVPHSQGLKIFITVRPVDITLAGGGRIPDGTTSVSIFLVNHRAADLERKYRAYAFQTGLQVEAAKPFIARPDLRGSLDTETANEWDEKVADLQYRDVCELATGHNVSAMTDPTDVGRKVRTAWIPSAEVERVAAAPIPGVELGMEALAEFQDAAEAAEKLGPMVTQYRDWISAQRQKVNAESLEPGRLQTTDTLAANAICAANRIEQGIAALADPDCLEAFKLANRTMAAAARQRQLMQLEGDPSKVKTPEWRPFQLAFILMNLRGVADPLHNDREVVDLLFFPTGGGKTEAYLGLAAFALVLRRFRNPGRHSGGVSVLMRYTLRLLTLDQLGRAATLICALELEREQNIPRLGEWPFEIGLWVGSAATPNRMGFQGYTGPGADDTAYIKTKRFNQNTKNPSPIPIEDCPWCGTKFAGEGKCFRIVPSVKMPMDLRIRCANHKCAFSGDRQLPILGVDEPIYRRLPAFMIATVDKFAALPWTGETGGLLGHVDRFDQNGYYGPCSSTSGTPLGRSLPGPDLIIQDELHLISGPLGTIAGVYETAIDELSSRVVDGHKIKPKIIASTATVRRASDQIRALFGRPSVDVFPPPGPDRRDSFFAVTEPTSVTPARQYIGIAAPGKSLKVVLLRSALALLSAGKKLYDQNGGEKNKANPADPYMSLLAYFNSLRELGGSRRIVEDEVRSRLERYDRRRRLDPLDELFSARDIDYEVLELTSRVATSEVAATKRKLGLAFWEKEGVDVALATNMISVGLDIVRLGLMVVLGQPKTSAEYIQATSRVGREPTKPGLVVTLLNVHKPRDRSHYERFAHYHATFYRAVEASSVTPFAPRALDRALAAALVGLSRLGYSTLTPPAGASRILTIRTELEKAALIFAERAGAHDRQLDATAADALKERVLHRCRELLDDWQNIAHRLSSNGVMLEYQRESAGGGTNRLLHEFLNPELANKPAIFRKFRANRSMRDVEASIDITIKPLNDWSPHA